MTAPTLDATTAERALDVLAAAHGNDSYRVLRAVAQRLGASVAYIDRATIDAHRSQPLTRPQMGRSHRHIAADGIRRPRRGSGQFPHQLDRRSPRHRRGVGMSTDSTDVLCAAGGSRIGIDLFGQPAMITVDHTDRPRAYRATQGPLAERTAKTGDGLACPPLMVPAGDGWNEAATSVENPLRTRAIEDVFAPAPFLTKVRNHAERSGLDEPLTAMATAPDHGQTANPS